MAVLSRRETDGGFYTRINIGGIATRQVHPDAVRYLNKRGVYVGDEIPTELMRKLRSTKNWLYTKEELPFVFFTEHDDPWFGMRSAPPGRSSVRGTTQVVASGPLTSAKKRRKRKKSKQVDSVGLSKDSQSTWDRKLDPSSWSEPLKETAFPDPVVAAVAKFEVSGNPELSTSLVPSTGLSRTNDDRQDGKAADRASYLSRTDGNDVEIMTPATDNTLLSMLRQWFITGAELPLWAVLLLFVVIVAALGLATVVMDGIG